MKRQLECLADSLALNSKLICNEMTFYTEGRTESQF